VLDAYLFDSLEQVREITELWILEYNEKRPHDSLGCVPPLTFKPRQSIEGSTSALCG
jgi:putative transposase